jgi:hypothetical protein
VIVLNKELHVSIQIVRRAPPVAFKVQRAMQSTDVSCLRLDHLAIAQLLIRSGARSRVHHVNPLEVVGVVV